jgi:hypothetical protein
MGIIEQLFNNGVFRYIDSINKNDNFYTFDILKLTDNDQLMTEFIQYLTNFITSTHGTSNDIEKLAGIVSFDDMRSYPLIIQLGLHIKLPFIMVKGSSIQGSLTMGDGILLVIDYITDVDQLIKDIKYIETRGGLVNGICVLLDREDGMLETLVTTLTNYNVTAAFTITNILETLSTQQLLNVYQYEKLANYVNLQRNKYIQSLDGDGDGAISDDIRVSSSEDYPLILKNIMRSAILSLIVEKQTALCLSLDVNTWDQAKRIITLCGSKICMIKTRVNRFEDIVDIEEFRRELIELANKYKFYILEDIGLHGKPKDIWDTVNKGHFNIATWASFITISGNTINTLAYWNAERDKSSLVTCPIIQASYGNEGDAAINPKELEAYELITPIIITQASLHINNLVKLTPNVLLKKHVPTGAINYRTIEDAIVRDQNHIVIMGNAIYKGIDDDATILFNINESANESWRCFGLVYSSLIMKIKQYEADFKETKMKLMKAYDKNVKILNKLKKDDGKRSIGRWFAGKLKLKKDVSGSG